MGRISLPVRPFSIRLLSIGVSSGPGILCLMWYIPHGLRQFSARSYTFKPAGGAPCFLGRWSEFQLTFFSVFSYIKMGRISLPVRPFSIRLLFIGDSSGPGNSHNYA